ncbi:pentatricopeptide repeat-containing protein At1g05750, chloroplastic-like [Arachis hypogaea]|uniref:pentatricopeptide repeat-containing protein At1g05750, chloroplastic-like n=1 Tax=Arachis hypogaea TaxID=3818 RepID=UPI0010FC64C3|nr:pentatricopeptide repeat-containing protein At1g05750, chloroplastic-like [Arachis hypogaea]
MGSLPASGSSSRSFQQRVFSLLQRCNSLNILLQIHTQLILNSLSYKNNFIFKLLSLYVSYGHLHNAHTLFSTLHKPTTPSGTRSSGPMPEPQQLLSNLWSATIAWWLLGRSLMGSRYCYNVFVETSLVNFYAVCGGVGKARYVFDEMNQRSVASWNSMLAGYVRCGDFDGARRVFDEMPCRNVVSWTTMVAGCARGGKCKQALSLFGEMSRAGVELDQVALVAALTACAELGDLKLGRWIHWYVEQRFVVRNNEQPSLRLSNALIHMYASCGIIDDAYRVFINMPRKSTVSWTSIIMAFAKQGLGKEALDLFKAMLSDGVGVNEIRPDEVTFIGVLCACSHAGFVDEGRQIFASMKHTWGIHPRIEHYGCMVDLLSRAGFLDEAQGLIETMPLKPNDVLWGALLGGCRIHKNSELASGVANKVVAELNVNQAAGYLVLLSNIYAFAKRWQDVVAMRQKMIEMGVKKPPGRSVVQINGVLHNFVAGDVTHKHSYYIYETLHEITKQANWEDYEPDITELNVISFVSMLDVGFGETKPISVRREAYWILFEHYLQVHN